MRRAANATGLVVAVIVLTGVACGRNDGGSTTANQAPAGQSSGPAKNASAPAKDAAPAAPLAPATLTDVNLAAADMGGAVEELTGYYGPGLMGNRLIDSQSGATWFAPADWTPNMGFSERYFAKYPQDMVFSFFDRQPALVGGVAILPPDAPTLKVTEASTAPADVEVWTSMDSASERFTRVATATLEAKPGEQTITFPATEAKLVRLRLLSAASPRVVEIAEVRVLESVRAGYQPLFDRAPHAKLWKGSPREAAQRGLEWLQQSAVDWSTVKGNQCFGCHVHAQAVMGQAVALKQGYRVSMPAMRWITDFMRKEQVPTGTLGRNHEWTSGVFAAMGFAYAAEANGRTSDPELIKAVDYLLRIPSKDGSVREEFTELPIVQGGFMMTANALVAYEWAAAHTKDRKYREAADRALAWIAARDPVTTQDLVFTIVALNRYGTPEQQRAAWPVAERLERFS